MNLYDTITAQIVAELEKGAAPWVKPWKTDGTADHNHVSKKPYRGINRLLLGMSAMAQGFQSPSWATYKQWSEAGAQVLKGQ